MASGSFCLDFPAVMDCTHLDPWAKISPFSVKLLSQIFYHSNRRNRDAPPLTQ